MFDLSVCVVYVSHAVCEVQGNSILSQQTNSNPTVKCILNVLCVAVGGKKVS